MTILFSSILSKLPSLELEHSKKKKKVVPRIFFICMVYIVTTQPCHAATSVSH